MKFKYIVSILILFSAFCISSNAATQDNISEIESYENKISPILKNLYHDYSLEQNSEDIKTSNVLNEQFEQISLNSLPCFLRVAGKLDTNQEQELSDLGVLLGQYLPFEQPVYTAKIPLSSLIKIAELPYIQEINPGYEKGTNELVATSQQINVIPLWDLGYNGNGIEVVVIDSSGVDASNPFISDNIVNQYDIENNNDIAEPENDHGTHCTGIIAANPLIVETPNIFAEHAEVTPGTSQSGNYHFGIINENVDAEHQYDFNDDGDSLDVWNVLLADTSNNNEYDAVYIDFGDGDWLDANEGPFYEFEWTNMNQNDIAPPFSFYPIAQIQEDGSFFEFGIKGIASGSNITVIKASDETEVVAAIFRAVDEYEADVISCSMGWWFTTRDGTDDMCNAVEYAVENGAFFVKSAGNDQSKRCHATGSVREGNIVDFDLTTQIPQYFWGLFGGGTDVYLTWVNPEGVANDLDLVVYDAAGNRVAESSTNSGREESLALAPGTYNVTVEGTSVNEEQVFHLYCTRDTVVGNVQYNQNFAPFSSSNTLTDPGTAPSAFTVGAIYKNTNNVASYSSYGPTNNDIEKPNVVAPGGRWSGFNNNPPYTEVVSTSIINGNNYEVNDSSDYNSRAAGTSMAAPHVAGAAAVILEAEPSFQGKPRVLSHLFELSANNIGFIGWDSESGYGSLNVETALDYKDEAAVLTGLDWLRTSQKSDGSWSNNVGITSLSALCFMNAGYDESDPAVSNAIEYILSRRKSDGTMYDYRPTYGTSLATMALVATHNPDYEDEIEAAKNWLVESQWDEDSLWPSVDKDNWYYGGFGYGSHERPDLSNSQWALMALDAAGLPKDHDLWDKAQVFLARCQNRQENVYISDLDYTVEWNSAYNLYDDGGFIYHPGSTTVGGGQSYGSISGAGIWSLLLCDVDLNDPRMQDALQWADYNDVWDRNPGSAGNPHSSQFYYYVSMSKARILSSDTNNVEQEDWYDELTNNLTQYQNPDGFWINDWDGWLWENNPDLTTAYSILSLQTRIVPEEVQRLSTITFILHSHVDLHVYDPLGRHVGMNYQTGEFEIQIPKATYEKEPEEKLTIPELESGNYRIILIANSDGDYNLEITGSVENNTVFNKNYSGIVEQGEVYESSLNVAMLTGLSIHNKAPTISDNTVSLGTEDSCISVLSDNGIIEDLILLDDSALPLAGKPNVDFPHGFISCNITDLNTGQSVNLTLSYPSVIPENSLYWICQKTEEWYQLPVKSNNGDNIIVIEIKDGGIGDGDGLENGEIIYFCGSCASDEKPLVNAGRDMFVAANEEVQFSGSFSNLEDDSSSICWDFGDGNHAYGTLKPTHTYSENGTYSVMLTITCEDGQQLSDGLSVWVGPLPWDVPTASPFVTASFLGTFMVFLLRRKRKY
ncbi:S8 family serine peptidase [Methanolobus sp. WCC4]|uniref:S8 family serine peptidase n=1 Tax=Methanolobus sp. WCC4 TaxID=3125784 RepID=UPI0030F81A60